MLARIALAVIQVLAKAESGVLWTEGSNWGDVLGASQSAVNADAFGSNAFRVPVPIAGTFRGLTLYSGDSRETDIVGTVYKNGSATALGATLPSIAEQVSDVLTDLIVVAGDDVCLRWSKAVAVAFGAPGKHMGLALEWDGDENIYGIAADAGTVGVDTASIGGAFGNGVLELAGTGLPVDGLDGTESNTYSICATPGTLTSVCIKEIGSTATGGAWVAYARINKILQPNPVTLSDGGGFAVGTVDAPCALSDHVDIVLHRTDTEAPFATGQVAIGIAFAPDTPGAFMFCGGNNNVLSDSVDVYEWVEGGQLVTTEALAAAPVSVAADFSIGGLYTELVDPGVGATWTTRLRVSGADSDVVVILTSGSDAGSATGLNEHITNGDSIVLLIHPTGTPATGQFHWGLAAGLPSAADTDLPTGSIGPYAWVEWPRSVP